MFWASVKVLHPPWRLLRMFCPGQAGVQGHDRADEETKQAAKTTITRVARVSEDLKNWWDWDITCEHKAKDITPSIAWRRETWKEKAFDYLLERTREGHRQSDQDRNWIIQCVSEGLKHWWDWDVTSGHKAKDTTSSIAWRREAWKEEAFDDLPWKDESMRVSSRYVTPPRVHPHTLQSKINSTKRHLWENLWVTHKAHTGFPERVDTITKWTEEKRTNEQQVIATRKQKGWAVRCVLPVSYTHLTLPTRRWV